jgi:hypothetical protein
MPNNTPVDQRQPCHIWATAIQQCTINVVGEVTVAARAIGMTFEAMYNAWAVYQPADEVNMSLESQTLYDYQKAQTPSITTLGIITTAVSYAAYTVLSNLFPSQVAGVLNTALDASAGNIANLGDNPLLVARAQATGIAVGQVSIDNRLTDNSNQYGVGSTEGFYADTTGYTPIATFNMLDDSVNIPVWAGLVGDQRYRFMPLVIMNALGQVVTQVPVTPQWGLVTPFAMAYGSVYRPAVRLAPSVDEVNEVLDLLANLTDQTKSQVDVFAKNPGSDTPVGQWLGFAKDISNQDDNDLDLDIKMFFGLSVALGDTSIAVWDTKYYYDTVRPVTYIRNSERGNTINAWGGPNTSGPTAILGQNLRTFQRTTRPTPAFPEVVSGHSAYSAAAANVMAALRKTNSGNLSLTMPQGGITWDAPFPIPTTTVTFNWTKLTDAADAAGFSRRISGIHFEQGDLLGRAMGKTVGLNAYNRAMSLFRNYRVLP